MLEAKLGRFADKRLAPVGGTLLASMQRKRTLCVHRLAQDRNQAIQFGRLPANPAATTDEMLVSAGRLANQRSAGRHVLAIRDTTDLRFPTHEASKRGYKPPGPKTRHHGLIQLEQILRGWHLANRSAHVRLR